MSKPLLRPSLLRSSCLHRQHLVPPLNPQFTTTSHPTTPSNSSSSPPKPPNPTSTLANLFDPPPTTPSSPLANLSSKGTLEVLSEKLNRLHKSSKQGRERRAAIRALPNQPNTPSLLSSLDHSSTFDSDSNSILLDKFHPPHHLHVYATKHNTHITLTRPNRDPILSVSTGTLSFRKAARGSFDAAFQLAGWTMRNIQERGLMHEIRQLEVVLRGFGVGRDAITKVLLGQEGRLIRGKIVRITDATRLKFGGTRSPKPRRLG